MQRFGGTAEDPGPEWVKRQQVGRTRSPPRNNVRLIVKCFFLVFNQLCTNQSFVVIDRPAHQEKGKTISFN